MRIAFLSLATFALVTSHHAAIAEPSGDAQAIALEVIFLKCSRQLGTDEIAQLSGPSDAVAANVAELDAEGGVESINRVRMATVENQEASSQIGETVWVAVGKSQSSRGTQRSYQRENVGTIVTATPRVAGGAVIVDFEIEKSQLQRIEDDDDSTPPGSETLTARGTWRILTGHTVLASGAEDQTEDGSSALMVLASAQILGPPPRGTEPEKRHVKIFSLQHSRAEESAAVIRELLASDSPGQIRIAVDSRTNSLIIAAPNEDALATIEAVLQRLDRAASPPQAASAAPTQSGDKSASRKSAYSDMDKGELQAQLKMIQKSLLDAEAESKRVQTVAGAAIRAYKSAQGDEKADALLRMIEAQAVTRAPFNRVQKIKGDLAAAKNAYLRLLAGE